MASYSELAAALAALLRAVRNDNARPGGALIALCEMLVAEAKRRQVAPTAWSAFAEAGVGGLVPQSTVDFAAKTLGVSEAEARKVVEDQAQRGRFFVNSRYQVNVMDLGGGWRHLSIKRLDQGPIRSWRDLQRIKNELLGAECEAVEVYPAESRLVDTANQYHLWGNVDPAVRLPFGLSERRLIADASEGASGQLPLEES